MMKRDGVSQCQWQCQYKCKLTTPHHCLTRYITHVHAIQVCRWNLVPCDLGVLHVLLPLLISCCFWQSWALGSKFESCAGHPLSLWHIAHMTHDSHEDLHKLAVLQIKSPGPMLGIITRLDSIYHPLLSPIYSLYTSIRSDQIQILSDLDQSSDPSQCLRPQTKS